MIIDGLLLAFFLGVSLRPILSLFALFLVILRLIILNSLGDFSISF